MISQKHMAIARSIGVHAANAIRCEVRGDRSGYDRHHDLRAAVLDTIQAFTSAAKYEEIRDHAYAYRDLILKSDGYWYNDRRSCWQHAEITTAA